LLLYISFLSILLAVVIRKKYSTVRLFLLFLGAMLITLGMSASTMSGKVRGAQRNLHSLGLHTGPVDGTMESNTRAALKKYQESKGLPVTGKLDKATQEVMRNDTSIKREPGLIPGTGR
jgi:peptidoglycan hydrolase-like protein with peptidoglycan-binding domain